ncbi:MAG: adenylate/guanylate cyclase domain-containing protein [Alphaproteobacteria bacterium]|nr:adenylate/guanylate cyclase domain-containing protein [Alphaproteobacteria bacterium]
MAWTRDSTVAWLFGDARSIRDGKRFVEQLGRRMIESGFPLCRLRLGCRIIHPLFGGLSFAWSVDQEGATEVQPDHGYRDREAYIGSPLQHVSETGERFRRRTPELVDGRDHRVLFTLAAQGVTDYLGVPMRMSDGRVAPFVVATKADGGFTDQEVAECEELASYVAPVFETFIVRRLARTILNTYVGPRTGERVLSGQIKRGDGELINAAIWFSDLRDFTPLTENLEPQALLDLLNAYFETVSDAVTARGGEVLRFIGDAMLIVFPVEGASSENQACDAALDAADDAFSGLAALNRRRTRSQRPTISFGVGLHLGEVIYGNVGARERLDFTVMGPAVNRTARLESLTKELGTPLLMSSQFAQSVSVETRSLGRRAMKGVAGRHEVFAPISAP